MSASHRSDSCEDGRTRLSSPLLASLRPWLARHLPPEILLPVFLVTLLAKLASFLPAYAVDDYGLANLDATIPTRALLGQGRFGQLALLKVSEILGLQPHFARVFFVALALAVTSACATLVVRFWRVERTALAILAASLISIHPFTVEIFTFRTALGVHAVAFALILPLLVRRTWSSRSLLLAMGLLAVALSVYQVVLLYLLMVLILAAAIEQAATLNGTEPGTAQGGGPASWRERILGDGRMALLAVVTGGSTLYFLANGLLLRSLGISMIRRGRPLALAGVHTRLGEVLGTLHYRFLGPHPLGGRLSTTLLLALLGTALAGLVVCSRRVRPVRRALRVSHIAFLLAAGLLWAIGVAAVAEFYWPVPRSMAQVAVFWGGTLVLAHGCWGTRGSRAIEALGIVLLLAFVGIDNRALNDQLRLNLRDAAMANRILARLESQPGFTPTAAVAAVGLRPVYSLPYATTDMDMNFSAFGAEWSNVAILREISGYNLSAAVQPEQKRTAADYCRAAAPWPAPASVAVVNGLAIVCLATPPNPTP